MNTGAAEALNYAGAAPVFATERGSGKGDCGMRLEVGPVVSHSLEGRSKLLLAFH